MDSRPPPCRPRPAFPLRVERTQVRRRGGGEEDGETGAEQKGNLTQKKFKVERFFLKKKKGAEEKRKERELKKV